MKSTWSGRTVLPVPIEEVWAFLVDDDRDVEWRSPWVRSVRALDDGPLGVGSRYETVYRFFGREEAVVVEITVVDPPRRLAWRQGGGGPVTAPVGSYELQTVDGGTRLTIGGSVDGHGLRGLTVPGFCWYLRTLAAPTELRQLQAAIRPVST